MPGGAAGIAAGSAAAMPAAPERRRKWLGRAIALPLAAAGLAIILPWRALDVLHQWQALSTPAEAAQTQPAPPRNTTGPVTVTAASGTPAAVQVSPVTPPRPAVGTQHAPDGRLLAEIAQRAAALDQRDSELQTRAAQVAAADRLARQQINELTKLRQEIEKLVSHESEASEADINLLVGLYSNMKPTQAAAVLGRLEAPQAAEILQRLDIHAAGPVLAAMDPAAALAVTQVLASRRVTFRR
jgi:flagellar motility protein MotE (MotC chaperone)